MLKLTPILLLFAYMALMWFFSAWRLKQDLNQKSTPLQHPRLSPMLKRLGEAMDLPPVSAHIYEIEPVNGLAAPDGRIFLTRGFIRKLDACEVTPEELASVIAHDPAGSDRRAGTVPAGGWRMDRQHGRQRRRRPSVAAGRIRSRPLRQRADDPRGPWDGPTEIAVPQAGRPHRWHGCAGARMVPVPSADGAADRGNRGARGALAILTLAAPARSPILPGHNKAAA
jgi:hypothetical protein